MVRSLLLFMVVFGAGLSMAHATIIFNPSFSYYSSKDQSGGVTSQKDQQIINLKLGYLSISGLYLGFAYDMESIKYHSSASDTDRKSMGGTVGYVSSPVGGWQFLGTYYFKSDLESYEGSGMVFDLGYTFNIGSFSIGPLLSYRSWEYDKQNGVSLASKRKQTDIVPSIQLAFFF